MVEMYRIHHRIGRSDPTGKYEITRIGTKRAVNEFREFYRTDLGEFSPDRWKDNLMKAIENDKELDVLEVIKEHCKKQCAWLHSEAEITEYAMNILASRTFLCGNDNWKDVADKVSSKYFIFDLKEVQNGD